jgi:hypothetical protein
MAATKVAPHPAHFAPLGRAGLKESSFARCSAMAAGPQRRERPLRWNGAM